MATFDLGRVTPLYKGDYSASASYELNDVVLYNGNLYWHVQVTATVGILPTDTTVWKLAFADEGVRAEIRGYADNAQNSADSALASKSAAAQSASQASASESHAALSAQTAQTAETEATASAQTATTKASEAAASATSAQEYDESAQQSAVNAQASATNAAASEAAAKSYAEDSAAYLGAYPTDTAEGEIASFSDGADDIPLKSLVIGIEPVQDLHGYDSPWPAGGGKNICPNLSYLTGSNMYFGGNSNGSRVLTLKAGTYTFSVYPSDEIPVAVYFMDSTNDITLASNASGTKVTITLSEQTDIVLKAYSSRFASGMTISKFQLEEGSTATDWTPYSNICPISGWTGMTVNANGTEITISWESEAGTVYGGMLDVTNGVLTVTKGFIQSYSGEVLSSVWISDRDTYTEGGSPTTGAEVCYTLAEPIIYQLTPTEVKSQLGTNNIYADTGDITVEYRADTSAYIAKKIAEAISALS